MSDLLDLIHATVKLEQPLGDGRTTVGTGFVVTAKSADGAPRTILITADHVFSRMPRDKALIGFRQQDVDLGWRFAPVNLRIRDAKGAPLWTKHPTQDVAAIELPAHVTDASIPTTELPGDRALESLGVRPGDEMMVLGFPRGFAANTAGFPILRAGKVASYPLSPADRYPTYLVDFNVFAGNSGGPVYVVKTSVVAAKPNAVITGLLTQQLKVRGDRLAIGNVTQADFITETIALIDDDQPAEVTPGAGKIPAQDAPPASNGSPLTSRDRLRDAWNDFVVDLKVLFRRTWIVLRDWVLDRITPEPKRA